MNAYPDPEHWYFLRRKCWLVKWRRYHAADSPFPIFKLTLSLHVGEYPCFTIGGIPFRLLKRNGAIGLSFLRWNSSYFSNLCLFWKFSATSGTRTLHLFVWPSPQGRLKCLFRPAFVFPASAPWILPGPAAGPHTGAFHSSYRGGGLLFTPEEVGGGWYLDNNPERYDPAMDCVFFCSRIRHCVCFTVVLLIT
jgi:hypothetical protein